MSLPRLLTTNLLHLLTTSLLRLPTTNLPRLPTTSLLRRSYILQKKRDQFWGLAFSDITQGHASIICQE
jgi:hypothetical protein